MPISPIMIQVVPPISPAKEMWVGQILFQFMRISDFKNYEHEAQAASEGGGFAGDDFPVGASGDEEEGVEVWLVGW